MVIPCYNRARFLDETLASLRQQTFVDWECILVDGGTDDTAQVAQQWVAKDPRFRYFKQATSGPSAARNFGVAQSGGTYIFPLDDDDLIAPDYFERALAVIEADASVKVVHCRVMQFGHIEGELQLPAYSFENLLLYNCMICCCLFRRSDFDRVGGYDENLSILEDWDFWLSLLTESSTVHRIDAFLYHYRKHQAGSLVNSFSDTSWHEKHTAYIYAKHMETYLKHHGHPVQLFKENRLLRSFRDKTVASLPYRVFKLFKK